VSRSRAAATGSAALGCAIAGGAATGYAVQILAYTICAAIGAPWLIIAGVIFKVMGLAVAGLVFFAAAVVFTFVTLPVEFGASRRALAYVEPLGLNGERADGARSVLRAAGWTYVAAALTALLTFLYYLWLVFGSRR